MSTPNSANTAASVAAGDVDSVAAMMEEMGVAVRSREDAFKVRLVFT